MDLFDIDRLRSETPGCENSIHFNNAGASLMPQVVLDAVKQHLDLECQIGGYEAFDRTKETHERFYESAAKLIGALPEEIAFIENATRAWDMAFYSFDFGRGDRILTAQSEYASNYIAFLQVARKTGAVVEAIPNDEYGRVSLKALQERIDEKVKLIAITQVPTNGGLINPAAEIGAIARQYRIPYLLDACQSVGQMPVNVQEIGCDMLSATGRKYLRGPRATGFLYVEKDSVTQLEPPFLDLHAATWTAPDRYEIRPDARRFETWEQNYAGKIGLTAAIDYAMNIGLEPIQRRVFMLAKELRTKLSSLPRVVVRDLGVEQCGIVTFTVEGMNGYQIKNAFAAKNIHVSVSDTTSTLLDMQARGIPEVVRASVHYYNTEDEIDRFCDAVRDL